MYIQNANFSCVTC